MPIWGEFRGKCKRILRLGASSRSPKRVKVAKKRENALFVDFGVMLYRARQGALLLLFIPTARSAWFICYLTFLSPLYAILTPFFILFGLLFYPIYGVKPVRQGWRTETNIGGAKEIFGFYASFSQLQ
jgi:hypothetical protein